MILQVETGFPIPKQSTGLVYVPTFIPNLYGKCVDKQHTKNTPTYPWNVPQTQKTTGLFMFPRSYPKKPVDFVFPPRCGTSIQYLPSLKLTISPLKIGLPNRKVVFQPSTFRSYVPFREGIFLEWSYYVPTTNPWDRHIYLHEWLMFLVI